MRSLMQSLYEFINKCFFSVIIVLNLFLLIVILTTVLVPIKTIVFILSKCRPGILGFLPSQKSLLGSYKIHKHPILNMCPIFIFDGHIDIKEFRTLFQERVMEKLKLNKDLMYPELKMFWSNFFYYPVWKKDKNFDLSNHVRLYDYGNTKEDAELKLPDPEEGFCTEEDLNGVMEHLLVKPWKKHRSPWEFLVVQNFKYDYDYHYDSKLEKEKDQDEQSPKSCTIVIFRIHHAMGDGYSLLKLLLRDLLLVPPTIKIHYPKKALWQKALFYAILPLKVPWDAATFMYKGRNQPSHWFEFGTGRNFNRKVFINISKPIDTQLIKDIKNKYSVGYNSVLAALVAGASKRIMEEHGQDVPKDVTSFIPLPLPGHPDGLAVHATGYTFQMTLDKKLTSAERLFRTSKAMTPSQYDTFQISMWFASRICDFLPNSYFLLRNFSIFTIGLPNFPGPTNQPEFTGLGVHLIDCISLMGPGSTKTGTFISLLSSNGKQRFTFIIDQAFAPNKDVVAKFGDFIEDEVKELLQGNLKDAKVMEHKV